MSADPHSVAFSGLPIRVAKQLPFRRAATPVVVSPCVRWLK